MWWQGAWVVGGLVVGAVAAMAAVAMVLGGGKKGPPTSSYQLLTAPAALPRSRMAEACVGGWAGGGGVGGGGGGCGGQGGGGRVAIPTLMGGAITSPRCPLPRCPRAQGCGGYLRL